MKKSKTKRVDVKKFVANFLRQTLQKVNHFLITRKIWHCKNSAPKHPVFNADKVYAEIVEAFKPYSKKAIYTNPFIVGCKCGKAIVTKEWDTDLGANYYYYKCEPCNYYWEGPIYTQ